MLAKVLSFAPLGIEGKIVTVEVDLRSGLPGIDIVGLPDNAIKEAKERVRVAVRNSGFQFPPHRILVNLSPAGLKKIGAGYDLPIALAILAASNQLAQESIQKIMVLGELNLGGETKGVMGVLSAVAAGLEEGIETFIVPRRNLMEARVLKKGVIYGTESLKETYSLVEKLTRGEAVVPGEDIKLPPEVHDEEEGDLADIKGHWVLKRALEVAASGGHHIFLFGPPGSGKTMAARRLPTILPRLENDAALKVTQIYSMSGLLPRERGLITTPPFRTPHHSATLEGIIGGGKVPRPGEVSLAHEGILFLDEVLEFKRAILQGLREPLEERKVTIARANTTLWYPAAFQLAIAANPCPCGNLGSDHKVCLCTTLEINRYWKRLGGALLDRIDIRVPLKPVSPKEITAPGKSSASSGEIREKVQKAVFIQEARFRGLRFSRNSRIPPGLLDRFCPLKPKEIDIFNKAIEKLGLSSRACHSILKVARTIADLDSSENIREEHLLEAVQHRRYGDSDFFWNF